MAIGHYFDQLQSLTAYGECHSNLCWEAFKYWNVIADGLTSAVMLAITIAYAWMLVRRGLFIFAPVLWFISCTMLFFFLYPILISLSKSGAPYTHEEYLDRLRLGACDILVISIVIVAVLVLTYAKSTRENIVLPRYTPRAPS